MHVKGAVKNKDVAAQKGGLERANGRGRHGEARKMIGGAGRRADDVPEMMFPCLGLERERALEGGRGMAALGRTGTRFLLTAMRKGQS